PSPPHHRSLHPFPPRRSSDLANTPPPSTCAVETDTSKHSLPAPRSPLPAPRSPLPALPSPQRPARQRTCQGPPIPRGIHRAPQSDRKSTRLNSSHVKISYAVF